MGGSLAFAPLRRADARPAAEVEGMHPRALSILLVEDEPRLRQVVARALAGHGHAVTVATDAAEAAACMGGEDGSGFDLMVLDVNLPDATGWDVLRTARASGRCPPVVVVSAAPPNPRLVRELGARAVLHKPYPIDALLRLAAAVADEDLADGDRASAVGAPTVAARDLESPHG